MQKDPHYPVATVYCSYSTVIAKLVRVIVSLTSRRSASPCALGPCGMYIERGDCHAAEKSRVWSPTCPRCQEVPGAGVCPAPGTLSDFVLLFNRTFVLCFGDATCPRHRGGYWPRAVHERMSVIDGHDLDRKLAEHVGDRAAAMLGILPPDRASASDILNLKRKAPDWLRIVRHRVLALLATLKIIELAHAANLPNVLVLEGDVRPVPPNALTRTDVDGLRDYMASRPWEIVRPSGYFYDFAQYRRRGGAATPCPQQCRCERTGLTRACLVPRVPSPRRGASASLPSASQWLEARCDVRDTVGFAAHARTFHAFRRLRHAALQTILEIADALPQHEARSGSPANSTFGAPLEIFNEKLPWFDKWLPARFNNLYLLPSIMVQQIRQGDERTSAAFRRKCMLLS